MTTEMHSGPWSDLVRRATSRAVRNLAQMIGQDIDVTKFELRSIPIADIASLVGGPEVTSVGIYLTVSGSADGHIMLIYEPGIAAQFVDLLMEQPAGTTTTVLGEMEASALGEMGNIVGGAFLSVLADGMRIDL